MYRKGIWLVAGIVVAVAAIVIVINTVSFSNDVAQDNSSQSVSNSSSDSESEEVQESASETVTDSGIVIHAEDVSEQASFYDVEIDGSTVEIFAVLASDGTVRLAMNTCQVCNGSPYAYFEQEGEYFVCQNCGNQFSSDDIGLVSGGCNPVPITEEDYTKEDGTITVSDSFIEENAYRFSNWKQF